MSVKALLEEAIALYQAGKLEDAESCFSSLIKEYPDNADAYNLRGVVRGSLSKIDKAIEDIKNAIDLKPDAVSFYYNLGQNYKKAFQLKEAAKVYKSGLEHDPKNFAILKDLVVILRYEGELNDALHYAKEMVSIYPENAESHNMLGEVFDSLGDTVKTEECYVKAIEVDPDNAQSYSSLGNLKHNHNMLDEAEKLFEKSLLLRPDQPIIKHALAAIKGETPDKPGEEFVSSLFDFYAADFDDHMKTLGYQVPDKMYEVAINILGDEVKNLRVIDLGCGTGVCGQLFKKIAKELKGVDLAPKMLTITAKKEIYDELILGDVVQALAQQKDKNDLILAADTLIYVGALEEFFKNAGDNLADDGLLLFSIEEDSDGDKFYLHSTGRYKHSKSYIEKLVSENNLKIAHDEEVGIRIQFEKFIPGRIMALMKDK